jgi:hypothetical protein
MFDEPADGATVTAANPGFSRAGPHSCLRQWNNWLTGIPAARATSDTTAPGSIAAATIRRFSSADQRRRGSADVVEDGFDRTVCSRADGDGALRCSFEALSAIGASQPDDAKTGAKALFRVRTSFEDQFAER